MKASRVIKLSKNMRPFISRIVRDGRVQHAFAEKIGRPAGACVAGKVTKGMSGHAIHAIAKECTRQYKGIHLF